MPVWGIVVAAGRGSRFGAPKQFLALNGVRLVDRAVTTASAACDHVVVVLPPGEPWAGPPVTVTAVGGATRSDSVRSGLASVPSDADVVVVHDAARPLATARLFAAVVDAVRAGADAAVPGISLSDTVKQVDGDRVVETVERDDLVAVQTPQAFRAAALRAAHARGGDATDDAALVEQSGGVVVVVAGDRRNIKITGADDLALAAALAVEVLHP
jgi:2-C-methyl-D-erythritol 4-phosphate cytidylyltransferase